MMIDLNGHYFTDDETSLCPRDTRVQRGHEGPQRLCSGGRRRFDGVGHRQEKGTTGLIIVSGIKLNRDLGELEASGGVVEVLLDWNVDSWLAEPVAFQVRRS